MVMYALELGFLIVTIRMTDLTSYIKFMKVVSSYRKRNVMIAKTNAQRDRES